jgi:hypothetical protein
LDSLISFLDSQTTELRCKSSILGRVVKAMDLSPIGQCPREFEPRRLHMIFVFWLVFGLARARSTSKRNPSPSREVSNATVFVLTVVCMAQWIRRLPTEQETAGSNPAMDSFFFVLGY